MEVRGCAFARLIFAVILLSAAAQASDWQPLAGYEKYFEIDESSVQDGLMSGARQRVPTRGVWLKTDNAPKFEVWVDCKARTSSTYTVKGIADLGTWSTWAPIPPDTMEWAVWQYLCKSVRPATAGQAID